MPCAPQKPAARKGITSSRWRINGHELNLVNVHLYHDSDNIAAMDRQVGTLLTELEKAGRLDDTAIMVFSDHGVGLPRGKRCVYDSGTRVPLIVRWPTGRGAGGIEERVVSFEDFAPHRPLDPRSRATGLDGRGRVRRHP